MLVVAIIGASAMTFEVFRQATSAATFLGSAGHASARAAAAEAAAAEASAEVPASRRQAALAAPVAALLAAAVGAPPKALAKRPTGVNNPGLLPQTDGQSTTVIDVAKILTESQERQVMATIKEIEQDSKVKLRVLTQTYPNSPGLAIRDYWGVDDLTLIYVHDTGGLGESNVVNFNAPMGVEKFKPVNFWRRAQNVFGNRYYIRDHGDGETVIDVVNYIRDEFKPKPPESS